MTDIDKSTTGGDSPAVTSIEPELEIPTVAVGTTTNPPLVRPRFDELTPYQQELRKQLPKTFWLILILGGVMVFSGFADDAFVPALQTISQEFGENIEHMQILVPVFLFGLGVGQFIWGPFADRYGRRALITACTLLSIASNFWIEYIDSYYWLVFARTMQGVVYAGLAIAPSIILKDVYTPREFIVLNSWVVIVFLFAPALSPVVGGLILIYLGWHWIFHFISVTIALILLIYLALVKETLDPDKRQAYNLKVVFRNYRTILSSFKSVLLITITCVYGMLIWSFPTLIPAVLLEDYHIAPDHLGYYMFVTIIFVILGLMTNNYFIAKGINPGKVWLIGATVQLLFLSLNLLIAYQWFGFELTAVSIIFAICINVYFNNFQLANMQGIYLMDYSHMTGTAASLITALRLMIPSAIVSFFVLIPRHHGATILLLNVVLVIITYLLTVLYHWKYPVVND